MNYISIFYDLETTSLDVSEARILQFSCVLDKKIENINKYFDKYVDPGNIEITNSDIHHITKDVIKKNNGIDCKSTIEEFHKWINSISSNNNIILLSHNNHDYDKLVLQHEYDRNKLIIPENWLFFDTLSFVRQYYTNLGYGNYSLGKLYEHFFKKELKDAHSSLVDVKALKKIFNHISRNLENDKKIELLKDKSRKAPYYEKHENLSITYIKGIGEFTAMRFSKYYITTVENIIEIFKKHSHNEFDDYLKNVIKISYEDNRKRIISHLEK